MKIRLVGVELLHVDGRTEITKVMVAFGKSASAPKNDTCLNHGSPNIIWQKAMPFIANDIADNTRGKKITLSGTRNHVNYCVIFTVYTQFTNLHGGRILQPGGPRVEYPWYKGR